MISYQRKRLFSEYISFGIILHRTTYSICISYFEYLASLLILLMSYYTLAIYCLFTLEYTRINCSKLNFEFMLMQIEYVVPCKTIPKQIYSVSFFGMRSEINYLLLLS